jgi:tripartite-type tricarboxylate transporter receptor subunit TctC
MKLPETTHSRRPSFPWKGALLAAGLLLAGAAQADTWPSRPIRFVVPFGPGGANDLVTRAVAEGVSKELGQPVIVDNKPGAGSALGTEIVAKSAPDGYTFLTPAGGVITNLMIRSKIGYKEDDLIPVAMMAVSPSIIVVGPESPIKDLKGLVAASKTAKGGLNFATAGTGSTPHFVAEMLRQGGGAQLQIVPYKSGADAKGAVLGKQVEATSEASPVVMSYVKGGKLRAVASTWSSRVPGWPDLPTAVEQGFPNLIIGHWSGVFAPKGTPDAIVERMNQAVDRALKTAEVRSRLVTQGTEPVGGSRAEFQKFLAAEKARLAPIVKAANMKED